MKAAAKRKVRIVRRRLPSRNAILSGAIGVGVCVISLVAWRVFRPTPPPVPYIRTLADVMFTFECERGHRYTAPGQVGSAACPICQRPAYPRIELECPVHGPKEVEVEFALDDEGFEPIVRLRYPGGEWRSAQGGLRCPSCQSPLVRPPPDDLSHLGEKKSKNKPGERVPPKEATKSGGGRPEPTP